MNREQITILGGAICAIYLAAACAPAHAGIPRGVMLIADEQDADAATGITIARGNAELTVEKRAITGRADVIELNPVRNEIQFKGRAQLTVGRAQYQGEAVTCTLDFDTCANAASLAQPAPPAPMPSAETAAVINPR